MIPHRELLDLRGEWQLRLDVIEKDYILGWILAAIATETELARTWVFKGGTCLRKCYYETYRFSEDLDFTVIDGGPEDPVDLLERFQGIADWLHDEAGIEIVLDERSFVRRPNLRGNPTTLGKVAFRGPSASPSLAKIKLDITSDEMVTDRPVVRPIAHPYSDDPLPVRGVLSYSISDLFAEKLRALAQRCRPRDLYDVVHLHRHPDLIGQSRSVRAALERKCQFVEIDVPDATAIHSSPFRDEVEQEWENMLAHQLPHLPPFEDFWESLEDLFSWLQAERPTRALPRAERGDLDPTWAAPRAMASWRRGAPLELIRFAGANRLKVQIDYRAERGRHGPRVVEPYALRRSREGFLLLFVLNDRGQLRSYRLDRIAGVRITDQSFRPRYRIEF